MVEKFHDELKKLKKDVLKMGNLATSRYVILLNH